MKALLKKAALQINLNTLVSATILLLLGFGVNKIDEMYQVSIRSQSAIKSLTERVDQMVTRIEFFSALKDRDAQNAELKAEVVDLKKQIGALQAKLRSQIVKP